MSGQNQNPSFPKITLKYKTLGAFAKAARTTFGKGRMTLKSKKDFSENERIMLSIKIPDLDKPIEIIGEIIQIVPADRGGAANTYGVRWLNFTEKKLSRLEAKEEAPKKKKAAPARTAAEKAKKPEPEPAPEPPAPTPEPAPPPEPAQPDETVPASEPEAAPPDLPPPPPVSKKSAEYKEELQADEEYTIDKTDEDEYPSFEPKPQVIIPPSPSGEEGPEELSEETVSAPAEEQAAEPEPLPLPEEAGADQLEEGPMPLEDADSTPGRQEVQPAPDQGRAEDGEPVSDTPEEAQPEEMEGPELADSPIPAPPPEETAEAERTEGAEAPGDVPRERAAPEEAGEPGGIPESVLPPPPPTHTSFLTSSDAAYTQEPEEEEILALDESGLESADLEETALPSEVEAEPEEPAEKKAAEEGLPAKEEPALLAKPFSSAELEALGAFLQKLLQLMLQPDQAYGRDSQRKLKSLYEEFKTVMSGRSEIVLYVRSAGAVKEYMLAGDVQKPVNLKNALAPDHFGSLAKKLVDFFEAKKLVGIQFGRYLTEDGFRQFVARTGNYDPSRNTPEELASGLIQEGVFHVSPVYEADRIGKAGSLDFRVDMTLTRLRGDLKRIKLVAEAMMEEDPRAVWTLRVEDALKSLADGRLRAEVLLFAHMVVEGQDEFTEFDLAQEVIFATPVEMLVDMGQHLAGLYQDLFSQREAGKDIPDIDEQLERTRAMLRQSTARLIVDKPEVGTKIMYGLYRKGVFELGELPPELRERVMTEQFLETFLENPETRIKDFESIRNLKDYKIAAGRYARMVVVLVRRGDIEVAEKLFRTLVGHIRGGEEAFPERPQAAREAFKILGEKESLTVLTEALREAGKAEREKLAAMVFAAGPAAASPLVKLLAAEKDRALRRLICEILTRLGEPAAPELVKHIKDPDSSWYLARNLIMVLSDMKSEALKDEIEPLLKHEEFRVREQALVYSAKVFGVLAEPSLISALSDPEAAVRRKSVGVLSRFPQISDPALAGLAAIVRRKLKKEPSPDEEQELIEAAEILGKLGARALPDGTTLEDTLIGVLEQETGRGLLGRLAGQKSFRTPKMRAALTEALGKTGSSKAKKTLGALAKDKEQLVKESALAAIARIESGEGPA
jgi:HEAT repeat protein